MKDRSSDYVVAIELGFFKTLLRIIGFNSWDLEIQYLRIDMDGSSVFEYYQ